MGAADPQPATQDELFEMWWRCYPRKVGKGAAREKWRRLAPTTARVKQMLDTLAWQRETDQWRRDEGQFIPHPSTYLHQERYDDEPIEIGPSVRDVRTKAGYSIAEAQAALEALTDGGRRAEAEVNRADALGAGDTGKSGPGNLRAVSGGRPSLFARLSD